MKRTIRLTENEFRSLIQDVVKENVDSINKKRKEAFRRLHERATSPSQDVMRKYYGITENKNKPVKINEVTLDRIINKHGTNGMINISANRSDQPEERNVAKTKELLSDIKKSGYSYLPTYGGYRGKDGVEDDYEPSFIVFNYTTDGETKDFEGLKDFGVYLCKKYEQSSVLIKEPGQPAIYLNGDGEKVNSDETDTVWKNDPTKEFFTSLKSKEASEKEIRSKLMGKYKTYCHRNNFPVTKEGFEEYYNEHLTDIDSIGKRYTYDIRFDECYVNPMPQQLVERMRRKGEVMIWE